MLNRVEQKFGRDSVIYYGDWSRKDQMRGCDPSPTIRVKKLISKRFEIVEVNEYKTSIICSTCHERLSRYRRRDGTLSYSRLCCTNCRLGGKKDRSGLWTGMKTLLRTSCRYCQVGVSPKRPSYLTCSYY